MGGKDLKIVIMFEDRDYLMVQDPYGNHSNCLHRNWCVLSSLLIQFSSSAARRNQNQVSRQFSTNHQEELCDNLVICVL